MSFGVRPKFQSSLWSFDFWQVANFSSLSFLIYTILLPMPTLQAVVKVKRDGSYLSACQEAVCMVWGRAGCSSIPLYPHPQKSVHLSWYVSSCSVMPHGLVGQGMACVPFLEPSHARQTSHVPLLYNHCGRARASVAFLHPPPIWQHSSYGCNVPSWCHTEKSHGKGIKLVLRVLVAYSSRNKVPSREKPRMPHYANPQE